MLLQQKMALEEYLEQLGEANKDIEREMESFVNVDESVCKTLEIRD